MRDRIIMEVTDQQSVKIRARFLWVQLICECDLYAKIYGMWLHFTDIKDNRLLTHNLLGMRTSGV